MKNKLMIVGLAGLMNSSCVERQSDVSIVNEKVELSRPEGCYSLKDIRIDNGYGTCRYQILCRDADENVVLYDRSCSETTWKQVKIK